MPGELDIRVAVIEEHQKTTDKEIRILFERLIKHMDKEEAAFSSLYKKISAMEKELVRAFKERDKTVTEMRMKMTKMIAYVTAGYAVFGVVMQIVLKVYF